MLVICGALQEKLAADGAKSLKKDADAQDHIAGCADCFAFIEALSVIEANFSELRSLDASDRLVAQVVEQVKLEVQREAGAEKAEKAGKVWTRRIKKFFGRAWSFGEVFPKQLLVLSLNVLRRLSSLFGKMRHPSSRMIVTTGSLVVAVLVLVLLPVTFLGSKATYTFDKVGLGGALSKEAPASIITDSFRGGGDYLPRGKRDYKRKAPKKKNSLSFEHENRGKVFKPENEVFERGPSRQSRLQEKRNDKPQISSPEEVSKRIESKEIREDAASQELAKGKITRKGRKLNTGPFTKLVARMSDGDLRQEAAFTSGLSMIRAKSNVQEDISTEELKRHITPEHGNLRNRKFKIALLNKEIVGEGKGTEKELAIQAARLFLEKRQDLKGLTFKTAAGYWSNTYVPGDPEFRSLNMRLSANKQAKETLLSGSKARLDDASHQTTQPFDSPKNSALAVYLHADRKSAEGQSRMLIQVGLKGTPRHSGARPAMNIGLVLDLRGELNQNLENIVRALLSSFREANEIGDRLSVTVAGKPGGMIIEPKNFKHGHITVALKKLFSPQPPDNGESLSLAEALKVAMKKVSGEDDPTAPLGSSAVILITSQSLGSASSHIAALAHKSAVSGIPFSAIGIGEKVRVDEINSIALSGQGNRRFISSPAEAKELVNRELLSVSRVVARAVRLRIRLAPGVKLVDVLGSTNLSEHQAKRVREAEQSIDKRISRNLGIQADRGEDEEGIQIVIPAFYADDEHVIVLDVVVPGPGPVADVTARFKDLVFLKNGVSRSNLSLSKGSSTIGPLELNVLKNLLAFELSQNLKYAATEAGEGNAQAVVNYLSVQKAILRGITLERIGLSRDPDILNDINMLEEYISLINPKALKSQNKRRFLENSLRYAGYLKVLPRPQGAVSGPQGTTSGTRR